jgi:hypothetical protein
LKIGRCVIEFFTQTISENLDGGVTPDAGGPNRENITIYIMGRGSSLQILSIIKLIRMVVDRSSSVTSYGPCVVNSTSFRPYEPSET